MEYLSPPDRILAILATVQALHAAPRPPVPDSPGGEELSRESDMSGDGWSDDPVRTSFDVACLYFASGQHLVAYTARAMELSFNGFGVPVLARAALESFGTGHWIMEPGISSLVRAARAKTVQLDGWWWRAKDELDQQWLEDIGRRREELVAGGETRGLKVSRGTSKHPPFVGEPLPKATDRINAIFPPDLAVYRQLSGFAHGGMHALQRYLTPGEQHESGVATFTNNIPPEDVTAYGLLSAWGLLAYAHRLFGWSGWLDENATAGIDGMHQVILDTLGNL